MKKLYKVLTRYGNVATIWGWQIGCTSSMKKIIGTYFPDMLLLKKEDNIISYRTREDLNNLKRRYYFL